MSKQTSRLVAHAVLAAATAVCQAHVLAETGERASM
jgi:hypothetical protein